jgi:hypothetical protein
MPCCSTNLFCKNYILTKVSFIAFLCRFQGINQTPLRKGISILLLVCFTLYHFGYYGVYFAFKLQLEQHWVEKIYAAAGESQGERLMEIPLSVPYLADEEEFRPTNTSFVKDGKHYRAIKQRYIQDTLQVVYVPDTAKSNLTSTIKQWVNTLIQDELPDSGSGKLLVKIFAKDYIQPLHELGLGIAATETKNYIGFIFSTYQNQSPNLNSPPPELV